MKTEELRLGNCVMYENTTHVVEELRGRNNTIVTRWIKGTDHYIHTADELDPIPLTEEILLKCGFGRRGDKYYLVMQTGVATHSIYIEYVFSGDMGYGDMWIGKEMGQTKKVFLKAKYLHQLQNLIHCLTGNEMEVNI